MGCKETSTENAVKEAGRYHLDNVHVTRVLCRYRSYRGCDEDCDGTLQVVVCVKAELVENFISEDAL